MDMIFLNKRSWTLTETISTGQTMLLLPAIISLAFNHSRLLDQAHSCFINIVQVVVVVYNYFSLFLILHNVHALEKILNTKLFSIQIVLLVKGLKNLRKLEVNFFYNLGFEKQVWHLQNTQNYNRKPTNRDSDFSCRKKLISEQMIKWDT